MQPTTTMTTATAKEGADAPEEIKNTAKTAILQLTPQERSELLTIIKQSRCEQ